MFGCATCTLQLRSAPPIHCSCCSLVMPPPNAPTALSPTVARPSIACLASTGLGISKAGLWDSLDKGGRRGTGLTASNVFRWELRRLDALHWLAVLGRDRNVRGFEPPFPRPLLLSVLSLLSLSAAFRIRSSTKGLEGRPIDPLEGEPIEETLRLGLRNGLLWLIEDVFAKLLQLEADLCGPQRWCSVDLCGWATFSSTIRSSCWALATRRSWVLAPFMS